MQVQVRKGPLATRARLDLCAMFGRLDFDRRDIEYLGRLEAKYWSRAQIQSTVRAGFRRMIHDVFGVSGLLQRLPSDPAGPLNSCHTWHVYFSVWACRSRHSTVACYCCGCSV